MNSWKEIRQRKLIKLVIAYGLVAFMGVVCIIIIREQIEKRSYYVPERDVNAESGVPLEIGLREMKPKENMRIGIYDSIYIEEGRLFVYLTNDKENEYAMNVFLYDEDKNLYAQSGLIWQEQYLPYLQLDKELLQDKDYYMNVVFYNIKDMTNEGSIWIRVGKLEERD